MAQLFFYFDQTRCIGCNACAVACKDWNGIKPGIKNYRSVGAKETGSFVLGTTQIHHLSTACNHCQQPSCLKACPADAIYKRESDGLVQINPDKCAGMGECIQACPYAAIHLEDRGNGEQGYKCTFCEERLAEGRKPSCVAACPQRALDYGSRADLMKKYPAAVPYSSELSALRMFPSDTAGSDGRELDMPTGPSILFRVKPTV